MTVLFDFSGSPPRKRLCLSVSNYQKINNTEINNLKNLASNSTDFKNSMPIEAGGAGVVGRCGGQDDGDSPITALSNLGNTCFLNSVLYTLRFAPSFMHNLHHLAQDLKEYTSKYSLKCSSLGRGGKSWSSKDLPSLSMGDINSLKIQVATDKLHQLYEALHTEEIKDHMEPFHPHNFLHSLRDVNPIFEGNQQHDAHELLVCLLDNIRETCQQLKQLAANAQQEKQQAALHQNSGNHNSHNNSNNIVTSKSLARQVRKSLSIGVGRSKNKINEEKKIITMDSNFQNGECITNGIDCNELPEQNHIGHNFISENFEGVSLLRTTCLECEQVTQRKETFCDICVPITNDIQPRDEPLNVNKLYQNALITEEYLHDSNKYWCENCMRYNEAKRCVKFETLPKLLTLQIKRFSSGYGSVVSKVNEHMPTPLTLGCFCEQCNANTANDSNVNSNNNPHHQYSLYGVIMHLGATIASGHYVAYVKARDASLDYDGCPRDQTRSRKTASLTKPPVVIGPQTSTILGGGTQTLPPAPPPPAVTKKKSFQLWFSRNSSSKSNGSTSDNSSSNSRGQYFRSSCRGSDCCGVRLRNLFDETSSSSSSLSSASLSSTCNVSNHQEPVWLECDDETVRVITRKQLEEILAQKQPKNSALTPYLLFYARQQ